ncbi:MAG: MMPL family transporter, partial [Candidatus Omnitrophica bacterium]|nr:MMPL family transporter [Candidatus Omnitrophota bacterium]
QATIELTDRIHQYIASTPETTFDFATSLASYVPEHQEEKISLMGDMERRFVEREELIRKLDQKTQDQIRELRRQLKATPFRLEDIPDGLRTQYEGNQGKVSVVYVYPKSSLLDGQLAKRFVKELRSLNLPTDTVLAGEPVVYADILILLEKDTPRAILISFGVVILLLAIHFRNPKHVFWVLLPVMLAFLWLVGIAGLSGFNFNYMNVAILPSILGAGIDNGIFIFHRYKKEKKSTLFEIMRITGKAVIVAGLTTMTAFASISFAEHQGMFSMGLLGFMGFACCLLASVLFTPALIEFLEMRYWHPFRNRFEENNKTLPVPEFAQAASSSESSSFNKTK